MNFKEFWKILQVTLQQERQFLTLKQNKRFTARFERSAKGELIVRITTEDGKIRGPIPSNEFEGIWDNLKGLSHETRFINKGRRLEAYPTKKGGIGKSMNVAYIVKLIEHVVQNQNIE